MTTEELETRSEELETRSKEVFERAKNMALKRIDDLQREEEQETENFLKKIAKVFSIRDNEGEEEYLSDMRNIARRYTEKMEELEEYKIPSYREIDSINEYFEKWGV